MKRIKACQTSSKEEWEQRPVSPPHVWRMGELLAPSESIRIEGKKSLLVAKARTDLTRMFRVETEAAFRSSFPLLVCSGAWSMRAHEHAGAAGEWTGRQRVSGACAR